MSPSRGMVFVSWDDSPSLLIIWVVSILVKHLGSLACTGLVCFNEDIPTRVLELLALPVGS